VRIPRILAKWSYLKGYELLRPDTCALALFDHQPQMFFRTHSHKRTTILHNVQIRAMSAKLFVHPFGRITGSDVTDLDAREGARRRCEGAVAREPHGRKAYRNGRVSRRLHRRDPRTDEVTVRPSTRHTMSKAGACCARLVRVDALKYIFPGQRSLDLPVA
jgi:hypothetical protein